MCDGCMERKPQWGTMYPTDDKTPLEAEFAETLVGFNNDIGPIDNEKIFKSQMQDLMKKRDEFNHFKEIKQNNMWSFNESSNPTKRNLSEPERVANNIPSDYRHNK